MKDPTKAQAPILQLKHDKDINIATASSRMAVRWKNQSIKILKFVQRLQKNAVTAETTDEYRAMSKADQGSVKDIGAFVGGSLKGGRRRKEDVANRSILTFDLDYGTRETIDIIKKRFKDVCFTVYSTHKHTTAKPRLRLIIYPDRVMSRDEYQPVMRKLAEGIDMEAIDDGSYDVNRLFYWPSSPSDGEVVFYHHDQPFLSVDKVLSGYGKGDAWKDTSGWPRSSRETQNLDRMLKKQQNPLEKKGLIGAFCRVVSIHEALDVHLEGTYKKESKDRYTYIDGTGVKGLIVYDGLYCFSNHDSDPASNQLCNAFDIIRIHKFGHLDDKATYNTPTPKLPSFKEMMDWARDIEEVKEELIKSKIDIDPAEFDVFAEGAGGDDKGWLAKLQTTDTGDVKPTFYNAVLIMRNDPTVKDRMKWNEFTYSMEASDGGSWVNAESFFVREYIGRKYSVDFPENKIEHAMENQAVRNRYHPVQDYLFGLKWDRKERVETLFVDYFGCADNAYVREASQCWFTAAVSRIIYPGFKFDTSIVIAGAQGIGKTTFIRELGLREWYGELSSFDPKIATEEILGKWIIEISEMGATNRHELETQKSFLSACHTRTRLAYERRAIDYRRQCVFIGSTNQDEYLKDSTGNRRWWPLDASEDVKFIDIDKLRSEVDQIWAEAMMLYSQGKSVFLSASALNLAEVAQEEKREEDAWQGIIEEWLSEDVPTDRYDSKFGSLENGPLLPRDRVCIQEIWDDCLDMKRQPKPIERKRIGGILKRTKGWKSVSTIRFGVRYGRQKGWRKNAHDIPF